MRARLLAAAAGSAALGLLAASLMACTWTSERPTRTLPPEPTVASSEPLATRPPPLPEPTAEPSSSVAELDELPRVPILLVAQADGVSLEDTQAGFATAPISACKPSQGGFVRILLTADDDRTAFRVDPASNVDAATSECFLSALSVVDVDELMQSSTSPSDQHSTGMASVLVISW